MSLNQIVFSNKIKTLPSLCLNPLYIAIIKMITLSNPYIIIKPLIKYYWLGLGDPSMFQNLYSLSFIVIVINVPPQNYEIYCKIILRCLVSSQSE